MSVPPVVPPIDQADPVLTPLVGDATLVFENKAANPGIHALVIGVSDYLHMPEGNGAGDARALGMRKLESPALSAYRVAQWIVKNHAALERPVASVRLLICPSAAEKNVEPELKAAFVAPTLDNAAAATKAWQKSADSATDGMTIFFFSGHGIRDRNSNSATMLFQDFGAPVRPHFFCSTELQNIVDGMNPSATFTDLPLTQLYFLDACRADVDPAVLLTAQSSQILDDGRAKDTRARPVYFATSLGGETYGKPGEVSVFADAMIGALETGIDDATPVQNGDVVYPITSTSLGTQLVELVAAKKTGQFCQPGGVQKRAVLRVLKTPPKVQLTVNIAPTTTVPLSRVEVFDVVLGTVFGSYGPPPTHDHPYVIQVPAGIYRLAVFKPPTAVPPAASTQPLWIKNGFPPWTVNVP